jgi:hypothetical protein
MAESRPIIRHEKTSMKTVHVHGRELFSYLFRGRSLGGAILLPGINAFAQSNAPLKGDVNEDGKVDEKVDYP